mgnify:CR=1 FL=1
MKRFSILFYVLVVGFTGFTAPSWAQDFVGTRAKSLGGAYRAIATGNDAIYFNPAGLPQLPRYSPEAHYLTDFSLGQQDINISVVDSKSPFVSAGIGYAFSGWDLNNEQISRSHTATLALAVPLVPSIVNVGTGLKYVNLLDALVGNPNNILSADLGMLVMIPGGLNLAAVGYNLVPVVSDRMPVSVGLGLAWNLGPFSALFGSTGTVAGAMPNPAGVMQPLAPNSGPLRDLGLSVDYHYPAQQSDRGVLSVGAEYLLMSFVPLRMGYEKDWDMDKQHLSAGAGCIFPSFAFDVAFRQNLDWVSERQLSFALKFFFDPYGA